MDGLLSASNGTRTGDSQRLIDNEIELHQASILSLKSRRNSELPISRLPPEILSSIFSIVRDQEPRRLSSWIQLTHVSRHWRNVGIQTPTLWTEPPLENPPWVSEMLKRSKETLLSVEMTPFHMNPGVSYLSDVGLDLSLEHSQHIKDLTLYVDVIQWNGLKSKLPKSAPQLESLNVVCSKSDTSANFGTENILHDTPKLRRLELFGFQFDWRTHSHLLLSLTHLKLSNIIANNQLTWGLFADALKGMPGLQSLDLENAFPSENTDEHVSWTPIYFPSLRVLRLICRANQAEVLLSCFTFPPTAKVKIDCSVPSITSANFSTVLTRLQPSYSNLHPSMHFQTLLLLEPPYMMPGVTVKLFMDALAEENIVAHNRTSADLEFTLRWYPSFANKEILAKTMDDVFNCGIPLQNVRRLLLGEMLGIEKDSCATTVARLNLVESLVATRIAARFSIDAINHCSHYGDTQADNSSNQICFPHLSSIYLDGARFKPADALEARSAADTSHVPIDMLRDLLAKRSKSGAGSIKLTFRHCRKLFKSDIDVLTKVAREIDWDEELIFSDSDDDDYDVFGFAEDDDDEDEFEDDSDDASESDYYEDWPDEAEGSEDEGNSEGEIPEEGETSEYESGPEGEFEVPQQSETSEDEDGSEELEVPQQAEISEDESDSISGELEVPEQAEISEYNSDSSSELEVPEKIEISEDEGDSEGELEVPEEEEIYDDDEGYSDGLYSE